MTLAARRPRAARALRLSLKVLAAHPLRTLLSVSGLAVGVAAVMTMTAIGDGAERRVLERVQAMGTDMLVVTPPPAPPIAGRRRQVETVTTLRVADAVAVAEEASLAVAAAPAVSRVVTARREGLNTLTMLSGTTTDGLRIRNLGTASGRVFDEMEDREQRRVALIGPIVARNLFGDLDPIGRELRLDRVPFEVIGLLRPRGTDAGGTDLDNEVVVPLGTAMRRVLNIPYVNALYVQAAASGDLDALEREVRTILERRHPARSGVATSFTIRNQAVLLRTERGATRALERMTVGVAGLALLVGGVGIIAIMLLSVRERVREIGLRRAVGARRDDIRVQFLLESGLLAAAGSVAGIVLGITAASAAALLGPWELVLDWRAPALAVVASTVLGLVVGMVPAQRAARLEPIDALRAT